MKKIDANIHTVAIDCGACGTRFTVQHTVYDLLLRTGRDFYCPLGHVNWFVEPRRKRKEAEEAEEAKERVNEQIKITLWDKIYAVLSHKLFGK